MHELTRLLWGSYGQSLPKGDEIIREYLTKAANSLGGQAATGIYNQKRVLEILGLSEEKEKN